VEGEGRTGEVAGGGIEKIELAAELKSQILGKTPSE